MQAAYKIEIGGDGLAFKCADRYTTRASVLKDLPDLWVLRPEVSTGKNSRAKPIVACAKAVIDTTNRMVEIGPLAVKPDCQVNKLQYILTCN